MLNSEPNAIFSQFIEDAKHIEILNEKGNIRPARVIALRSTGNRKKLYSQSRHLSTGHFTSPGWILSFRPALAKRQKTSGACLSMCQPGNRYFSSMKWMRSPRSGMIAMRWVNETRRQHRASGTGFARYCHDSHQPFSSSQSAIQYKGNQFADHDVRESLWLHFLYEGKKAYQSASATRESFGCNGADIEKTAARNSFGDNAHACKNPASVSGSKSGISKRLIRRNPKPGKP